MPSKWTHRIPAFFRSPLNGLLFAVPLAFAIKLVPSWNNDTYLFFVATLGIIPLAAWMSRSTEHISEKIGPGFGGLLSATFNNAPELIISLVALSNGLEEVVKASIIGSILGNILLVIGVSMFLGGLRYKHLHFNQTSVSVAATSLCLATIGLIIPTLYQLARTGPENPSAELGLSSVIAAILFAIYLMWLIFSLFSHKQLFLEGEDNNEGDSDNGSATWPLYQSIPTLFCSTLLTVILSEFMADSVERACHQLGISTVFVSIIVVAIIGNAGESSAVLVALKNKMHLSLNIAIGSSLQIALFVTPLIILASHLFGHPITLEFSLAEIVSLTMAIVIMVTISSDGECNWMEGAQLIAVYLMIAALFFFLPEPPVPTVSPQASVTSSSK
jgi:Ca2+:H+ antiporter